MNAPPMSEAVQVGDSGVGCLLATSSYSLSPLDSLSTVTLTPTSRTPRRSATSSAVSVVIAETPQHDEHKTQRCGVSLPRLNPTDQRLGSPLAKALSQSAVNLDNRFAWLRRAQTATGDRHDSLGDVAEERFKVRRASYSFDSVHGDRSETTAAESEGSETDVFEPHEEQRQRHNSADGIAARLEQRKRLSRRMASDPGLIRVSSNVAGHADSPSTVNALEGLRASGSSSTSASSLAHPVSRAMSRGSCDLAGDGSRTCVGLPDVKQRPNSSGLRTHQPRASQSLNRLVERERCAYYTPPLTTKTAQVSRQSAMCNSPARSTHRRYSDSSALPRRSAEGAAQVPISPQRKAAGSTVAAVDTYGTGKKLLVKSRHRPDRKTL